MKIKLPEHEHKLTNILKVLLFSLLMLLPFLDIGTRCGYVLLNKNAYQSYYGETINETIETPINWNELTTNKVYLFNNPITPNNNVNNVGYIFVQNVVNYNGFNNNVDLSNVAKIRFYKTENYNTLQFYDLNETTQYTSVPLSAINAQFTFEFLGYYLNYTGFENANFFYELSYNKYSYLDNVFDYSIDKMANSPLYNWTTQTGMYTGVNAMTTGLGITTPLFAILITYWMFLTIIYIILDIVLSLFTFMTHIFTKKE